MGRSGTLSGIFAISQVIRLSQDEARRDSTGISASSISGAV